MREYKVDEKEQILSSVEELEKFTTNHVIWKDFKVVIEGWLEGITDMVLEPETNTIEALADYQGRANMCKLFLELPNLLIDSIKLDELNKEREQDG
ncbi:MAG: hypothetical protein GY804_01115 [Alphaproteobacteria bacterium]|nr:hypothetical protein [Alphaproteobacteria bacterium]